MILDPKIKADRVNQVYTDLNRKFEEEETERKAKTQKIAYINLYGFPVDMQALVLLSREQAEAFRAVVFYQEGRVTKLGLLDPDENINRLLSELQKKGYIVEPYLISKSSFSHVFSNYDKIISSTAHSDAINLASSDKRFNLGEFGIITSKIEDLSATELIDTLIGTALKADVSDIHIEPENNDLKIRFRIDGVLQDLASLKLSIHHKLLSRIKIMTKMKLNITSTPQDGSFSLTYDKNQIDVRVSILPSAYGESVVMRILRQDKSSLDFDELGITGLARERVLKETEKPNGMILTTGPTGSGKTTTLYSVLNRLNEPGVKVITIEDPVEYKIPGITQTPIDARSGMTFASALRAILRQDPDIVMVGEMRDLETAEIACQAALTGHIVLSTLHTNDAPSAIPRLLDLGVKPFVLAPAINAIIGQRLVRKICEHCKEQYVPPANLLQRVEMILRSIPKAAKVELPKHLVFYHSRGCDKCHNLGYKGRIGVYEIFTISNDIEKLITKGATTTDIKNQAIAEGMLTMAQDGILKVLQGVTDIEEVFRVTEE